MTSVIAVNASTGSAAFNASAPSVENRCTSIVRAYASFVRRCAIASNCAATMLVTRKDASTSQSNGFVTISVPYGGMKNQSNNRNAHTASVRPSARPTTALPMRTTSR